MQGEVDTRNSSTEEVWRLLPFDRGRSDEHFARGDALARLAAVPTVWWHATDAPTLILGAGQRFTDEMENRCLELGVSVVKRQSGGTAIYADPDVLGLDIALPPHHRLVGTDVVMNYRWLGEVWVLTLTALGVAASLVGVEEAREAEKPPAEIASALEAACFGTLSPFEVAVEGRKLVGLAQVRRRTGVLLQSAIHLHFDRDRLAALIAPRSAANLSRALRKVSASLDESSSGKVSGEEIRREFSRQLEEAQHVRLREGAWSSEEEGHAASLVHA